ncbi:hypothetical protein [Egicoccus sp. AB-alg6-2]|uniref:hypothetical protein n=1 Tax=Egicoccus sp. AB-alg6-2 TaxID=3242692 RepID=UPI00359E09D5
MALPTTSELFTGTGTANARALRDAVDGALASLPDTDSFVLLAAGDEGLVHDASGAVVAPDGVPPLRAELHHDETLLGALASRGQIPRVRNDWLHGSLAALALLVHAVQPRAGVQSITLPRAAGWQALEATAAGIVGAARATDRRIVLVAAGDLAAVGDEPTRAAAWDEAAVAAVRTGDTETLAGLGPSAAAACQAAGWAPLTVLISAFGANRPFTSLDYRVVEGTGRLVAHGEPTA